jgi:hypothetical protein
MMNKQTVVRSSKPGASGVVRQGYSDPVDTLGRVAHEIQANLAETADARLADYEKQKESLKNPQIQVIEVYHVFCGSPSMGMMQTTSVISDGDSLRHTVDALIRETEDPKSMNHGGVIYIRKAWMHKTAT